jgi:hypothetical protein
MSAPKETVRSWPMGGLSTCNDYLAIGDYGATSDAAIPTYT